ncbi:hypothetical protein CA13_71960 [Planctomycetes bacterium CA13]|uniref:Thiol-disulfide oxidoreductase n=1 Tax=Novipirellula herctigrandis TaxID=2527986 RepID=A0A5C5YPE8_9BACT|nr:hypothetical protein CA13_71960 [Planctomycetes bacterium CA13]
MSNFLVHCKVAFPIVISVLLLLGGCSNSKPSEASAQPDSELNLSQSAQDVVEQPSQPQPDEPDRTQTPQAPSQEASPQAPVSTLPNMPHSQPATPASSSEADFGTAILGQAEPTRQLRADLTPAQLREFLAGADSDMQLVASGRTGIRDQQEAILEMQRIVKRKLEASRRLRDHGDATESETSEGARGELQSLSHLAALGDLKAAIELEELANANLTSSDSVLVTDSRLVLIGFAIESLQNGNDNAAQKITDFVKDLASSANAPGIPAMMVMGQARDILSKYEHDEEAKLIRDTIIDLYANASDPEIAKMAAQLAGSVQYDAIDHLLQQAIDGKSVSETDWSVSVQTLIDESPDLQTVQYLAGAALQFEGLEQRALADVTYEKLDETFSSLDTATGKEARLAIVARQARENSIGKTFDPDLQSVDGSALSMADYRGKIVLVPLWAMGFPESMQVFGPLQELEQESPDLIAVVGINLDPAGAPVAQFVKQNRITFPSFRAESSQTAEVANEVAARFGMVSAPFMVVLDQQARVASINYTLTQLRRSIAELRE